MHSCIYVCVCVHVCMYVYTHTHTQNSFMNTQVALLDLLEAAGEGGASAQHVEWMQVCVCTCTCCKQMHRIAPPVRMV